MFETQLSDIVTHAELEKIEVHVKKESNKYGLDSGSFNKTISKIVVDSFVNKFKIPFSVLRVFINKQSGAIALNLRKINAYEIFVRAWRNTHGGYQFTCTITEDVADKDIEEMDLATEYGYTVESTNLRDILGIVKDVFCSIER